VPIAISQDDEQQQMTVAVSDPWSVEEIAISIDRQLADHTWKYGTLYDLRGSGWIPSEPDVLWLVRRGQQQVARHGARGPVAVLIDASQHVDVVRKYADYSAEHGHVLVRVFDEVEVARAWLAQHRLE
jgi:hypothetical protein